MKIKTNKIEEQISKEDIEKLITKLRNDGFIKENHKITFDSKVISIKDTNGLPIFFGNINDFVDCFNQI